jgi:hypothetical protein
MMPVNRMHTGFKLKVVEVKSLAKVVIAGMWKVSNFISFWCTIFYPLHCRDSPARANSIQNKKSTDAEVIETIPTLFSHRDMSRGKVAFPVWDAPTNYYPYVNLFRDRLIFSLLSLFLVPEIMDV